jgi:hypothetical protein
MAGTKTLTYVGPFSAVDVQVGARILTVERGTSIVVDDADADAFLAQESNWREATKTEAKSASTPDAPAEQTTGA